MDVNTIDKIKLIKAMEFIARQVNDETVFEEWLMDGVADGDIRYGDLNVNMEDADNFEYYLENENFAYLMGLFLRMMSRAKKSGGLYCRGVVSK